MKYSPAVDVMDQKCNDKLTILTGIHWVVLSILSAGN